MHENPSFLSKYFQKMVFQKKLHCNMIFFVLSGKICFFFLRKYNIFSIGENERCLSQKICGNMIFFLYMYKCYIYDITILPRKAKMIFCRNNTFLASLKKMIFIPENMIFLLKYRIE